MTVDAGIETRACDILNTRTVLLLLVQSKHESHFIRTGFSF
jgi:hypothetical protein